MTNIVSNYDYMFEIISDYTLIGNTGLLTEYNLTDSVQFDPVI
jgi:hypothetical protein